MSGTRRRTRSQKPRKPGAVAAPSGRDPQSKVSIEFDKRHESGYAERVREAGRQRLAHVVDRLRSIPGDRPDGLSQLDVHWLADAIEGYLNGERWEVAVGLERPRRRGRPKSEETARLREKVWELRESGETWEDIAERVDRSVNSVRDLYDQQVSVIAKIEELLAQDPSQ